MLTFLNYPNPKSTNLNPKSTKLASSSSTTTTTTTTTMYY